MRAVRKIRRLVRRRHWQRATTPSRSQDALRRLTESFCEASSAGARMRRAASLLAFIWTVSNERRFVVRLLRWIRLLEHNLVLREAFQRAMGEMLADFDFVPLLAETGLPTHNAFPAEVVRRIFERLLPSARDERDAVRFLASVFPTSAAVERFTGQEEFVFERLVRVSWPASVFHSKQRLRKDLRQAIFLLAARVAGRGASPAIRSRESRRDMETSPFYQLVFITERLMRADAPTRSSEEVVLWQNSVLLCREELELIHFHMEDAGVSSALVYDLRSVEATLERMQLLAGVYVSDGLAPVGVPGIVHPYKSLRELTNALVQGRLNDMRFRTLLRDNLNLLARKTVERTGRGGEHYIAHTRRDYWLLWREGAGGGILTVFTAALKMRVIEAHLPLAIEGFLIGTDYAVSFLVLQLFGFALATKQPSMTAAALAGIVRDNRGMVRWSKISAFASDICRTQLAAAFSNVIAVCLGAVLFENLWAHLFRTHYLPAQSARHVYQTLHPFTSGTAIFAAFTGLLLWLAAVTGGWFENFVVFHRIPEAIAQHPIGARLGARTTRNAADWLERNAASWSTSIVLGYLLGFSPVAARFFGVALDVRHVTLSSGTLALAAARFGTDSFGHGWFYFAAAGIAITFVMNLGVSFSIASVVALRAYDVPWHEQVQIFRFLLREILASPLSFVLPPDTNAISILPRKQDADDSLLERHAS